MNRRNFIGIPFVTPLTGLLKPLSFNPDTAKGFKIDAGKDRYGEVLEISGAKMFCKLSAKDTAGQLCVYETNRFEKGGPAIHKHLHQDEWFYVLEGEYLVQIGDEKLTLKPGDSVFGPRNIPHGFTKISEGPSRMVTSFQPAGTMEQFFRDLARIVNGPKDKIEEAMKHVWTDHGMEMIGPPISL